MWNNEKKNLKIRHSHKIFADIEVSSTIIFKTFEQKQGPPRIFFYLTPYTPFSSKGIELGDISCYLICFLLLTKRPLQRMSIQKFKSQRD